MRWQIYLSILATYLDIHCWFYYKFKYTDFEYFHLHSHISIIGCQIYLLILASYLYTLCEAHNYLSWRLTFVLYWYLMQCLPVPERACRTKTIDVKPIYVVNIFSNVPADWLAAQPTGNQKPWKETPFWLTWPSGWIILVPHVLVKHTSRMIRVKLKPHMNIWVPLPCTQIGDILPWFILSDKNDTLWIW